MNEPRSKTFFTPISDARYRFFEWILTEIILQERLFTGFNRLEPGRKENSNPSYSPAANPAPLLPSSVSGHCVAHHPVMFSLTPPGPAPTQFTARLASFITLCKTGQADKIRVGSGCIRARESVHVRESGFFRIHNKEAWLTALEYAKRILGVQADGQAQWVPESWSTDIYMCAIYTLLMPVFYACSPYRAAWSVLYKKFLPIIKKRAGDR